MGTLAVESHAPVVGWVYLKGWGSGALRSSAEWEELIQPGSTGRIVMLGEGVLRDLALL